MKMIAAALAIAVAIAVAQSYQLKWSVVSPGGTKMVSSSYQTTGTVGQTGVNKGTSPGHHGYWGFWHPSAAPGVQEPEVNGEGGARYAFGLGPNAPNPFRSYAVISYSLPAGAQVDLRVFGRDGRAVTTLVSQQQKAGRYSVTWSLDSRHRAELANGVYFCRLVADGNTATVKMVKVE